jgi:hypothetical protein
VDDEREPGEIEATDPTDVGSADEGDGEGVAGDEDDEEDEEGTEATGEAFERPIDRFRRSGAGSVIAAGLLGVRDALEGRPKNEEAAIVTEAPGQPHRGNIDLVLDPDHPERSIAIVRLPPPPEPEEPAT